MTYLLPTDFTEPNPPQPFKYLLHGSAYPVRPEKRGNSLYWFMRKMRAGNTAVIYLGPVGSLTRELMDNAVLQINTELEGGMSHGAGKPV